MKASTLKTYEFRGSYPKDIDEEDAYCVGRAIVEVMGAGPIIVGADIRDGSSPLYAPLCTGISEAGGIPVLIGAATTDLLTYAMGTYDVGGTAPGAGVLITGGSLPLDQTGFNIYAAEGYPATPEQLVLIWGCAEDAEPPGRKTLMKNFVLSDLYEPQAKYNASILTGYGVNKLEKGRKPPTVTLAPTLSLSCTVLVRMLQAAGSLTAFDIKPMLRGLGSATSKIPDPFSAKMVSAMKEQVLAQKSIMGIAFNGDGSAVAIFDERGELVHPSVIGALIAAAVWARHGGDTKLLVSHDIVYPMNSMAKHLGVNITSGYPGSANMRNAMWQTATAFGADASGRYYFQESWWAENAPLAAAIIMQMLVHSEVPLSNLVEQSVGTITMPKAMRYFVNDSTKVLDRVHAELLATRTASVTREADCVLAYSKQEGPLWRAVLQQSYSEDCLTLHVEGFMNPDLMQDLVTGFTNSIQKSDLETSKEK